MERPDPAASSRSFKRSYVACVSCRARKARCIIKDKPPCAKCQREHRECQFDHRPKAHKHRDPPKWTRSNTEAASSENPANGPWLGRNEPHASNGSPQDFAGQFERHEVPDLTISDEGQREDETSPSVTNHSLYDRVRSTIVTGTNDALDILSDAALPQHRVTAPSSHSQQPNSSIPRIPVTGPNVTPGSNCGFGFSISTLSEPNDATLDLWDKSRFVRQGWFTAQEAVTYIDLFFKYLSPLSPVMVDQFRDHTAHSRLVNEEAMLCCTLLMVSSRFFMLPGAGGTSRSHFIHQRVWNHCEVLIKRILLGQEKTSTSKTRIIGTIESLMLISDWHPRALHFPPETDGWDGLLISPAYDRTNRTNLNNEEPLIRWREDVFEPAKRSNRMSWMLLGMASNLAYELGILSSHPQEASASWDAEEGRRFRAQKLLYTYVTQTAIRLGYPSVFPDSVAIIASRLPMETTSDPWHRSWIAYMDMHVALTQLSRTASSMFFQSGPDLQGKILSDNYADLLEHFATSLSKWEQKFETLSKEMSDSLRDSLSIEFHHLKACTGAVSIQAVAARASASGLNSVDRNPGDGLSAFITSKDARFLQDVISDSSKVLHIATMTAFKAQLPFAPARVKIIVISASVFLLKALSVGSTNMDVQAALYILDQCTTTLKSSPPDDMDFALRYATLIEKHTAHFRSHLTSIPNQVSVERLGRVPVHGGAESAAKTPGPALQTLTMGVDQGNSYIDFGNMNLGDGDNTWMALPFDSGIAPFNSGCDQLSLGLDVDSLNFLWSLPDIDQDNLGIA